MSRRRVETPKGVKQRRRRERLKHAGLCVRCGRRMAVDGVHCFPCAEGNRQRAREWQRRKAQARTAAKQILAPGDTAE